MRAYYFDDVLSDQRLPHIASDAPAVDDATLKAIGLLHWSIPIDAMGQWEKEIDKVAREREYKNRDIVESSRALMGQEFEQKMAVVWKE